jgi:Ca2+-binding EF-hand superfamily protein
MSNRIGGIGNNNAMMQGMRGMKPPGSAQMAEKLFSKLDTSGQGYIEKSDLQAAFDKLTPSSSTASSTSNTASIDDLFSRLDTNGNGNVTKQEFSETLRKLGEQLDQQLMSSRMSGGMPPPPPPDGSGNEGFSKDELNSRRQTVDASDSKRYDLDTRLVNNFDTADADGNGKVSFDEAQAYDQASGSTKSPSGNDLNQQIMSQIMQLMQAYNIDEKSTDPTASALSVLA